MHRAEIADDVIDGAYYRRLGALAAFAAATSRRIDLDTGKMIICTANWGSEELAAAVDNQRLAGDKGRPRRGKEKCGPDHVAGDCGAL
jgi:hypothetical protein